MNEKFQRALDDYQVITSRYLEAIHATVLASAMSAGHMTDEQLAAWEVAMNEEEKISAERQIVLKNVRAAKTTGESYDQLGPQ